MELIENAYWKVSVKVEHESDKGKVKTRKDDYIVSGISPTDVETKITKELKGYDFEIAQVSLTKIVSIIN